MKGIKQVSTKGMSREDWLAQRRKTIGGSDAAAIVGLSRYSTPYTIFMDIFGRSRIRTSGIKEIGNGLTRRCAPKLNAHLPEPASKSGQRMSTTGRNPAIGKWTAWKKRKVQRKPLAL